MMRLVLFVGIMACTLSCGKTERKTAIMPAEQQIASQAQSPTKATDQLATAVQPPSPERVVPPTPRIPTPKDMVGTWSVTLRADFTTCENVDVGDVKQRQWLIGFEQGQFKLRVLGVQSNESTEYDGTIQPDHDPPLLVYVAEGGATGIQLWIHDEDELEGRRFVASRNGVRGDCIVMYLLTAQRVK